MKIPFLFLTIYTGAVKWKRPGFLYAIIFLCDVPLIFFLWGSFFLILLSKKNNISGFGFNTDTMIKT
jgi:hypothetical protein